MLGQMSRINELAEFMRNDVEIINITRVAPGPKTLPFKHKADVSCRIG